MEGPLWSGPRGDAGMPAVRPRLRMHARVRGAIVLTHVGYLAVPVQATFGRDGAMFESLLSFVARMSLVLWGLVTLTLVIRFVGIRFYRRAARRALARVAAAAASLPGVAGPGIIGSTVGLTASATPVAAPAEVPVAAPVIAVVPVASTGIDQLQPANVPLANAMKALSANSADG